MLKYSLQGRHENIEDRRITCFPWDKTNDQIQRVTKENQLLHCGIFSDFTRKETEKYKLLQSEP